MSDIVAFRIRLRTRMLQEIPVHDCLPYYLFCNTRAAVYQPNAEVDAAVAWILEMFPAVQVRFCERGASGPYDVPAALHHNELLFAYRDRIIEYTDAQMMSYIQAIYCDNEGPVCDVTQEMINDMREALCPESIVRWASQFMMRPVFWSRPTRLAPQYAECAPCLSAYSS